MSNSIRTPLMFTIVFALLVITGFTLSWNVALGIFNMGLISAIMALGVNIQWGYAGLFNVGTMGFVALGGLGAILVAMPPVQEAWAVGGGRAMFGLLIGAGMIIGAIFLFKRLPRGRNRLLVITGWVIVTYVIYRAVMLPAVDAIERVDPAATGYLGGMGLPILLGWPFGGLLAAGAAWVVGKTALGLRSDYLAIATLGISEIIIAILKAEDWMTRGVKNVIGVPRPVPYEIDLQNNPRFMELVSSWGADLATASSITVKLSYAALFIAIIVILLVATQLSLNSPWGRMMRAIRDNEVAAEAMGKDVKRRHLQVFVLGCFVCGLAGAMMTTLDGQLVPTTYVPLRFTFLIWVMVIVGGSGNNFGAILGGFLIWYLWVMVEPWGLAFVEFATSGLDEGSPLRTHLIGNAAQMRLLTMGIVLLLVLRFSPRGLIPER